ncbi:hypothetical protein DYB32_002473 [Aphanomyces invadans]|uniref:Uncharacterized protein n=1 Tax=Aphanomyces invadans TaxID=157072 RepID=A0A418B3A8_9STRA|nr:hypothetical protein DYB32_002473 [Aphanomyces invadans]
MDQFVAQKSVPTARSALEAWQQWVVADPAIGLVCALKDYTKEMIRMDRKKYFERLTLGKEFNSLTEFGREIDEGEEATDYPHPIMDKAIEDSGPEAWEAMALTLRGVDEFTRQGIDGKKAQNRFLLLMRQHKTRNKKPARLSGAAEEETVKSRLLDDLASLFNDAIVKRKKAAAVVDAAEKAEKVKFVREQAMQRGRRQSVSDSSDAAEPIVTSKRKMIMDAHEMEVALEREKLEFKRLKFECELGELDELDSSMR